METDPKKCISFDLNVTDLYTTTLSVIGGGNGANPFPAYKRGYYYNGASSYSTLEGLTLNVNFSLYYWIRVQVGGVIHSLNKPDSIAENQENAYTLSVSNESVVVKFADGVEEYANEATEMHIIKEDWQVILVTSTWNGYNTKVAVSIDNTVRLQFQFQNAFFDSENNVDILGAEWNTLGGIRTLGNYYSGFIYSICYTPEIIDKVPTRTSCPSTGDYCKTCPEDVCLYDCSWT